MERLILPPAWCSALCKNSMGEICIERCAPERKATYFEEKKGLTIEDIPRYPLDEIEEMTKDEKFKSVVIYISKLVDHIKGVDNGEDIYYSRSRKILEDVKKQTVLLGAETRNPPSEVGTQRENKRERPAGVD